MAHALDTTAGKVAFAQVDTAPPPWHGLGQTVPKGAPLDVWAEESGLSFTIEASVPTWAGKDGVVQNVPDRRVLFRNDTGSFLSIVSNRYKITQPAEMLLFFERLIRLYGASVETAGALFGGKRYFACAQVGRDMQLFPGDTFKPYMFVTSGSDGHHGTQAALTTVRVVCNNTLKLALSQADNMVSIPHSVMPNIDEIHRRLGLVDVKAEAFLQDMARLCDKKMSSEKAELILIDAFGYELRNRWARGSKLAGKKPEDLSLEDWRDHNRGFQKIMELFNGTGAGSDKPHCINTAYGLLNAVTQYCDFDSYTLKRADSLGPEAGLLDNTVGSGATSKERFFHHLMEQA